MASDRFSCSKYAFLNICLSSSLLLPFPIRLEKDLNTSSMPSRFSLPTGPEDSLFHSILFPLKLKNRISSKSWSSVAIQYTGTKSFSGYLDLRSLHKLMVLMILYRK